MEETKSSRAEISSIDYLNKKRKFQSELLGMPFPKHVRGCQILECGSSSDFSTELKKFESNIFARGGETDPQSSKDSNMSKAARELERVKSVTNSFHGDMDTIMFTSDEATKSCIRYLKTRAFDEPSTSSVSWGGSNSCVGLYSTESRLLTKSSSSKAESLSTGGSNFEEDLEFGRLADYYSGTEYTNDDIDAEKELYNLLFSNDVAPSNYVLSSGRWSVTQDTHDEDAKKLTIDKEFEQYFSMLML